MMSRAEAFVVARAIVRVLADSTHTEEIHWVEEITGRGPYRRLLAERAGDPQLQGLLRERPELSPATVALDELRALPGSTLGGAYVRHLDDNGLTPSSQAADTRYVSEPDIAYLMRRFRRTHDIWHALLGLGITGHEEVLLHAFSWGQLRLPVSALVVVFGTLKHIVIERRWQTLRHSLYEAYQLGRDAAPLLPVPWETLWSEPIDDLRTRYHLRTCNPVHIHG